MPGAIEMRAQRYWLQHDLCHIRTLLNEEVIDWSALEAIATRRVIELPQLAPPPGFDQVWECIGLLAAGWRDIEDLKASVDRALNEVL